MFKLKIQSLFLISCLTASSCGGEKKSVDDKNANVTIETENSFNSDDFDFVLPQPISLAKAFQASGLSYNPTFPNNVKSVNNYQSKVKQLLNLGVYSTDLAYSALNEKAQEAREYLKAIQELGNSVGLKPVFSDKKIIAKFDSNLANMAAIEDLIYDIQEKSEVYMEDNDIRYLAVIQFCGAWTEGMYLGVRDIETNLSNTSKMSITIVDQMNILKNIIKGMNTYPAADQTLSVVSEKMSEVLKTYNNLASVKEVNETKTFISPKLTTEEFSQLAEKIKDLRNFIIK